MNNWFLVYCKSNQELRAEINLQRQGYTVYRPTIYTNKRKTRSSKTARQEALFPRYIFINVDPEVKSIAPVVSTLGVSHFVKFGNTYATAQNSLIDQLRSLAAEQSAYELEKDQFQPGDKIYVDSHGFEQVQAIFDNPCGEERAIILMNIMGNQSRVTVPFSSLTKATDYGGQSALATN